MSHHRHISIRLVHPHRLPDTARSSASGAAGTASHAFWHHILGALAPLLALVLTAAVGIVAWRAWSRLRLAASGCWFELRLGEQVSRAGLESLMRTLAGGLPRPLFGARPWVALWLSSWEDRADCGLFVSGGVSAAQVCSAVEQAFGAVTVQRAPGIVPRLDHERRLRVASLKPVGSRFLPLRVDHRVDPAGQVPRTAPKAGSCPVARRSGCTRWTTWTGRGCRSSVGAEAPPLRSQARHGRTGWRERVGHPPRGGRAPPSVPRGDQAHRCVVTLPARLGNEQNLDRGTAVRCPWEPLCEGERYSSPAGTNHARLSRSQRAPSAFTRSFSLNGTSR
jgi:hypothetical protein